MTNRSDLYVQEMIEKLTGITDENTDFYVLFHLTTSHGVIPDELQSYASHIYTFTSDILYDMGYMPLGDNLIPGSCHFPILKFYLSHSSYDYYWFIEDDVCFTGDWRILLNAFSTDDTDLISCYVKSYQDDPKWVWWESLYSSDAQVSREEYTSSFNPICRLSGNMLEGIHKALLSGWRGHSEAVMATVARHFHFSIKDMDKSMNKFYNEQTHSYIPLHIQDIKADTIYHPVKRKISTTILRKNCVITAVGSSSLHKQWTAEAPDRNFDLHLIVYDSSFSKYYSDADFISCSKGFKLRLVYDYLKKNPQYLSHYEYFFIPDDDIQTDAEHITLGYARHALQGFKYNSTVFHALLKSQRHIEEPNLGIVLGNPNGSIHVMKVCNPYCGACRISHRIIDDLLDSNDDICVRILFTPSPDERDIRNKPVKAFLAQVDRKESEVKMREMLNNWYLSENHDYDSFMKSYSFGDEELANQVTKVKQMFEWCEKEKIEFTPTFFINGYQLLDKYSVNDLKYFIY